MAETRRLPFDLPEAESELVAGYHAEYSGMKFGMFYVGEYLGVTLISAMIATLFFGGWLGPRAAAASSGSSLKTCSSLSPSSSSLRGLAARARATISSWPTAGRSCCRWRCFNLLVTGARVLAGG